MKLYFKATIVEEVGKKRLKVTTETLYNRIIDSFKVGSKLVLEVEEEKNRRSITQNNFYWLYLGIIANDTGDDPNSLHEYFKRALLSPKLLITTFKTINVPSTTTELSKVEFGEYMDRICALTNVPIPNPQAVGYLPT